MSTIRRYYFAFLSFMVVVIIEEGRREKEVIRIKKMFVGKRVAINVRQ